MNEWLGKSKMKIIDLLSWLKEAQRMGHDDDDDDDDEEDDIGIKRVCLINLWIQCLFCKLISPPCCVCVA